MEAQKKDQNTHRLPPPGKDLKSQYPEIAAEWDYERNGDLLPAQVFAHSNKKAWWKCKKCGQSWSAAIYSRTSGHGCPFDAGKLPIPRKTDLATLRPDLAEEWDYEHNGDLTPDMVTVSSGKKVWWKCKNCDHSWMATISGRSRGKGCPFDAGKLPIPGKTDLGTLRPDLAEEWDYEHNDSLTPKMVTLFSNKKVWWKCKICNQSWLAVISSRANGRGCPFDAGRLPIPGKTDLTTLYPDLVKEWDYEHNGILAPDMFTASSNKRVWWKCDICSQRWLAAIRSRTHGRGCPFDAGKLPIPEINDLGTLRPDLAEEWDYERNGNLTPRMVTIASGKKVWWKCKNCGQSWFTTIESRVYGCGCPFDIGNLPIPGKTDLASLYPDLIREWDYERNRHLMPEMVTVSSNKKVWWICKNCGQRWQSTISNRTRGSGCPFDAGKLPGPGKNDL